MNIFAVPWVNHPPNTQIALLITFITCLYIWVICGGLNTRIFNKNQVLIQEKKFEKF